MNTKQYYTAPSQEIFDDIKAAAITIWNTYDDTYGYRSEKLNKIADIQNVSDNAWYMVAMFDSTNQGKMLSIVEPETAAMIIDARGY